MAAGTSSRGDFELLRRGAGFHGYVAGPLPRDVVGAAGAIRYLVRLASEWGHLSGTRSRTSSIDWREVEVSDHAQFEFEAIDRESFAPTLKRLRKTLARTNDAQLSNGCVEEIVSLVFHEAFDEAFKGRAKKRRSLS